VIRRLFALGGVAATLLIAPAARAADPYTINVILPMTGPAAFIGQAQGASIGLIEEIVNRQGGINGRPVKFVVRDDQTSPQVAVQLMNGATAEHSSVIIGSAMVAACSAMSPLAKDGPVMYCLSPAMHPPEGSYVFSSGFSTDDLMVVLVRYFRERGWKRVAAITSADATGQDADRGLDAALARLENKDQALVDREHFAVADLSVSAQMARIKAANPQVIVAWATGTPFGTLLRGANDAGVELPIVTTPGNMTYAQMKAYASFLPKELYIPTKPAFAQDQLPNGPIKQAVMTFQNAFKAAGIRPDEGHISLWDATFLIVEALRKLGPNASAEQVRGYIASQRSWAGVDGLYDFRAVPQRGIGSNSVVIVRWDSAKDTWSGASRLGGAIR
jgi:branched-chain amino acid transport system substrate-binding protein